MIKDCAYEATYSANGNYTFIENDDIDCHYFFEDGDKQTVVGDSFSDAVAKCVALGKEPLFLTPLED